MFVAAVAVVRHKVVDLLSLSHNSAVDNRSAAVHPSCSFDNRTSVEQAYMVHMLPLAVGAGNPVRHSHTNTLPN